jgi:hypothetical protein
MADAEETLKRADSLIELSEGYMSDAEFREEMDIKSIRYLQAMANQLMAIKLQNDVIISHFRKEEEGI